MYFVGKSLSNQGQCPQDSSKEWMTRHVAGMPQGCLRAEANGPMKMARFGTERIHDTILFGGCKMTQPVLYVSPWFYIYILYIYYIYIYIYYIYIYGIHWDFNGI